MVPEPGGECGADQSIGMTHKIIMGIRSKS